MTNYILSFSNPTDIRMGSPYNVATPSPASESGILMDQERKSLLQTAIQGFAATFKRSPKD